jgi:hypothetical protein
LPHFYAALLGGAVVGAVQNNPNMVKGGAVISAVGFGAAAGVHRSLDKEELTTTL